jgi:hypothetical protein
MPLNRFGGSSSVRVLLASNVTDIVPGGYAVKALSHMTHTHTHTHTHTCAHTHIHTHAHTHTHTHTHTRAHTQVTISWGVGASLCGLASANKLRLGAQIIIENHALCNTYTHTHRYTHTHKYTDTHIYTCTRAKIHTLTHKHTYIYDKRRDVQALIISRCRDAHACTGLEVMLYGRPTGQHGPNQVMCVYECVFLCGRSFCSYAHARCQHTGWSALAPLPASWIEDHFSEGQAVEVNRAATF